MPQPAAERSQRPRSIAPEPKKRERDERAIAAFMAEGYKDSAEEDREIAEALFPLIGEASRD